MSEAVTLLKIYKDYVCPLNFSQNKHFLTLNKKIKRFLEKILKQNSNPSTQTEIFRKIEKTKVVYYRKRPDGYEEPM